MNIDDLEADFVALLRKVYDAKQDRDDRYAQMSESFDDSNEDLYITENILNDLGFDSDSFWEVVCPALVKSGVLESFEKYAVNEEKGGTNYPYHFRVDERKLFEGTSRMKPDAATVSYSHSDHVLHVNGKEIKINGPVQHDVLSIIFSHFEEGVRGEGVNLDEIAEEFDEALGSKKGSKLIRDTLWQIDRKLKDFQLLPLFKVNQSKVKLDNM